MIVTVLFYFDIRQILPHLTDRPKDLNGRGKRSRVEGGSAVGETTSTLRSVYVDSSLDYSPLSRVNYYGGHMEGSRQSKTNKSVFTGHL